MITGMTVGAGILGLPYVIAQVGLIPGLLSIALLGFIVLFINLMIGEVAAVTGDNLQLPGLAGRYLGRWAGRVLAVVMIVQWFAILVAYIVGEGSVLAEIFGGDSVKWSLIFWVAGSSLILGGLQRVKVAEKVLSITVILIIVAVSIYLLPHATVKNIAINHWGDFFAPWGIIIFALSAAPAIAEAHALLPRDPARFRKALIIGTIIPIVIYMLFSFTVVGALGGSVSEVATIGLGQRFGIGLTFVANVFAILAMSTGFMGLGTALKETLVWDSGLKNWLAKFLVVTIPLVLYLAGMRSFIGILSSVGGTLIVFEMIMMVLVYRKARQSLVAQAKAKIG